MVKIIGKSTQYVKRITCKNCSTELEYTNNDVRNLWSGTDYGGGPDGADGFDCPACSERVITKRW